MAHDHGMMNDIVIVIVLVLVMVANEGCTIVSETPRRKAYLQHQIYVGILYLVCTSYLWYPKCRQISNLATTSDPQHPHTDTMNNTNPYQPPIHIRRRHY
jgi:hypothetical protein